ncbi:MAG: hypothetical protein V4709_13015 [Pseudomonadota bacterium]
MAFYENQILPLLIDCACGMKAVRRERAKLIAGGFTIGDMQQQYLKGPRPMTWVSSGWASKA